MCQKPTEKGEKEPSRLWRTASTVEGWDHGSFSPSLTIATRQQLRFWKALFSALPVSLYYANMNPNRPIRLWLHKSSRETRPFCMHLCQRAGSTRNSLSHFVIHGHIVYGFIHYTEIHGCPGIQSTQYPSETSQYGLTRRIVNPPLPRRVLFLNDEYATSISRIQNCTSRIHIERISRCYTKLLA